MNCKIVFLLISAYMLVTQAQETSEKFLERLTDDQILWLFRTKRENVPRFSMVQIKSHVERRSRREVRPVEFEVKGQKFNFNVEPMRRTVVYNDVPIWTVESNKLDSSPNYTYRRIKGKQSVLNRPFYVDSEKMAVFQPYYNQSGSIYYDGLFLNGTIVYTIRRIPESWRWDDDKSEDNKFNHVIFGKSSAKPFIYGDDHELKPKVPVHDDVKLPKPLTALYPKVLLAIDYHVFKNFSESIPEVVKYFATYWNAVDLLYKQIQDPVIDIEIKGIIVAKDERAMNYVYQSRNFTVAPDFISMAQLTDNAIEYFNTNFTRDTGFTDYNVGFVMTGLETFSVKGRAYIGLACTERKNIGVMQIDESGYRGFIYASHELGHIFNLLHDSTNDNSPCYGYPSETINVNTVMAPALYENELLAWSKCSVRDIKYFASLTKAACFSDS